MTIVNNDVNTIENECFANLPFLAKTVLSLVTSIVVLCYFSPLLGVLNIVASLLLLLIPMLLGEKMSTAQKKYSMTMDRFNGGLKDILSGFEVVKSFGAEDALQNQFDRVNSNSERKLFAYRKLLAINHSLGESSMYLVMLLNYAIGAYLVVTGNMTVGALLGAVQMVNHVVFPIQQIIDGMTRFKGAKACRERIADIFAMETKEIKNKEKIETFFPVAMKDLTFGYQADNVVLEEVNQNLEAGKKYAVVGASGCGKSTLVKLLMGYYLSYDGNILLGKQEMRDVDRSEIYKNIAVIQQNVVMFDDTLRNNITMYNDYPDEVIYKAVKEAGLEALLEQMKDGLETQIEENGKNFSGGERQRISIARAFIRDTPMIIMDEATSSLDNQTAFQIERDILNQKGITALVVTHKYNDAVLKCYDEIIVLQHGKIVERGKFDELLEKKGYFYSLYYVAE